MGVTGRAEGKVLVPSSQIMRAQFRIEMVEFLFEKPGLVPQRQRMLSMLPPGDILESSG
jgi:hypothetical protein